MNDSIILAFKRLEYALGEAEAGYTRYLTAVPTLCNELKSKVMQIIMDEKYIAENMIPSRIDAVMDAIEREYLDSPRWKKVRNFERGGGS